MFGYLSCCAAGSTTVQREYMQLGHAIAGVTPAHPATVSGKRTDITTDHTCVLMVAARCFADEAPFLTDVLLYT